MGAISPAPALNATLTNEIMENIIIPTIKGMKFENMEYQGILYAGIMLTNDGPKVIEFNCRFGDPETQVILPRLKTDLVDIILKSSEKKINEFEIKLIPDTAITVVIASKGYPGPFVKGHILPPLDIVDTFGKISVFHSGTSINKKNETVSNGGRVLSITAVSENAEKCRDDVYKAVELINWDQGFYRTDIGKL